MKNHAMRKDLKSTFENALTKIPEALGKEGFGVLTQIDVKETLKKKLGADFRRYVILGACNPPLAQRALEADLGMGIYLPCNVVLYERNDGQATVLAVDPTDNPAVAESPALMEVARTVQAKLTRVLEQLS